VVGLAVSAATVEFAALIPPYGPTCKAQRLCASIPVSVVVALDTLASSVEGDVRSRRGRGSTAP
jgi:hypothetical protein